MLDSGRSYEAQFIDTHEGITLVIDGGHTRGATDLERAMRDEVERLREALLPFAAPMSTTRDGRGTKPETDTFTVEVEAGDWMRACVVLGRMDAEQLRNLPSHARPTDEFIDSLDAS